MILDHHERFQRIIDEGLAGVLSSETDQSLREHLATCATCVEYLSANNRVIASLGGFSFELNPTLNARVLEALKLQAQQARAGHAGAAQPSRGRFIRLYNVPFKVWAAIAVALSMSIAGSAFVYQVAKLLMVPMHFDTAQVQIGVLIFWLLPSLCSALSLLAAPGENRGMA